MPTLRSRRSGNDLRNHPAVRDSFGAVLKREGGPVIEPAARPCPFCGSAAEIEPWHGGGPQKRLISCSGQGDTLMRNAPITCHVSPSVTGSTRAIALKRWNTRGGR